MEIDLRPIDDEAIEGLLANLLPADRDEILATGYSPELGVRQSVRSSLESVAVWKSGRVACLTGVSQSNPLGGDVFPWLLSTDLILSHPKTCLRMSRLILDRWRLVHPYMTNYVDARHERAIRWLRWLGADLDPAVPFGPFRRPFHKFSFGDPSCA